MRLFRYRLRTFLIVTMVIAVWMGIHLRRTENQKASIAEIEHFGGWVRYDFQVASGKFDANSRSPWPQWLLDQLGHDFFHSVVEVNLVYTEDYGGRMDNDETGEAPLQCLRQLPRLKKLYTCNGQATDENMRHVAHLRHLDTFFAWDAGQLSDTGVAHLSKLKKLRTIHISKSRIGNDSLRVFAQLPELRSLSLQFNRFTRDGMHHLITLENLHTLWVCGPEYQNGNDVDDASLEFLLSLENLKSLGVQYTHVTQGFEDRILARFPQCQIAR